MIKNLNRIEFLVTLDCTGRCKHCSEGEHSFSGIHIDKSIVAPLIFDVAREYNIKSVMTFGGECLLYPDVVCEVHSAAAKVGIEKRQLITNGYFTKDKGKMKEVARMLKESKVNDILLSVDAFHQETIPIDVVKEFAECLKSEALPIRLSPAWLVSKDDDNPYNKRTLEIVKEFDIKEGDGNIIFPSGNAVKYLSQYFDKNKEYVNPYEEDPEDIRTISVEPDSTVFGRSVCKENIIKILKEYKLKKS